MEATDADTLFDLIRSLSSFAKDRLRTNSHFSRRKIDLCFSSRAEMESVCPSEVFLRETAVPFNFFLLTVAFLLLPCPAAFLSQVVPSKSDGGGHLPSFSPSSVLAWGFGQKNAPPAPTPPPPPALHSTMLPKTVIMHSLNGGGRDPSQAPLPKNQTAVFGRGERQQRLVGVWRSIGGGKVALALFIGGDGGGESQKPESERLLFSLFLSSADSGGGVGLSSSSFPILGSLRGFPFQKGGRAAAAAAAAAGLGRRRRWRRWRRSLPRDQKTGPVRMTATVASVSSSKK